MNAFGIDIGGSGMKGAPVDLSEGILTAERYRLPTPDGASPMDMAKVFKQIVDHFGVSVPVGVGFPAVVVHGVCYTAANVHKDWIGTNAEELFGKISGLPVYVLNDADAAGIAEVKYGAGRGQKGVIILLTLGTGVGSAIFADGHLVPNTEFGHMIIRGKDAEWRVSDAARQSKGYSWKKWAKHLQEYMGELEKLFSPDLFILGGGQSKNFDTIAPYLKLRAKVIPAQLQNQAGIVGAALYAQEQHLATTSAAKDPSLR